MTDSPYYEFEIDMIVRDGPDVGRAIDGYGGHWWGMWSAPEIAMLIIAGHRFYTTVDGLRAEVYAAYTSDGRAYLKTTADSTTRNNLSELDWTTFRQVTTAPRWLFLTPMWRMAVYRYRTALGGSGAAALLSR